VWQWQKHRAEYCSSAVSAALTTWAQRKKTLAETSLPSRIRPDVFAIATPESSQSAMAEAFNAWFAEEGRNRIYASE